jgi:hypothetical protein
MSAKTGIVGTVLVLMLGAVLWFAIVFADARPQAQAMATDPAPPSAGSIHRPARPTPPARWQFAAAMAHIEQGMSGNEVIAALGRPDDVRTEHDPDGRPVVGTREVWRYGTNGHLTFPTLGCVYIDTNGKVQYVYGGRGKPPDPQFLPEEDLRRLLRLIDKLPSYNAGWAYNPLPVIRVVNALLPLGKEKALAVIEEYLRVCSPWDSPAEEGLFLVLRVMFDVPKRGYMPPMYVGAPEPAGPEDPTRLPRFPILLCEDVPLLLVYGYCLGGEAEQAESHVAYFREHGGRLRARPLAPPDAPLAVFDRAWASVSSSHRGGPASFDATGGKLLLMNQLLWLVDSVYPRKTDRRGHKFSPKGDPDPEWRKIGAEVAKLGIRWDSKKDRYTFRDGTAPAERERKLYRRETWQVEGAGRNASVTIQRRDERYVHVIFTQGPGPAASVQIYAVTARDKPLAPLSRGSLEIPSTGPGSLTASTTVELAGGTGLQVRVTTWNTNKLSPVFKP